MMRCIKLGSHTQFQIKIIPVSYLDIVIPSLALFGCVLLYYYFYGVCSDMLTCLFCIQFFFQRSKLQRIRSIRIIDAFIDTKIIPTITGLKYLNGQFLKITAL